MTHTVIRGNLGGTLVSSVICWKNVPANKDMKYTFHPQQILNYQDTVKTLFNTARVVLKLLQVDETIRK